MVKLFVYALLIIAVYAAVPSNAQTHTTIKVNITQVSNNVKQSAVFLRSVVDVTSQNNGTLIAIVNVATKMSSNLQVVGPAFAAINVVLPQAAAPDMKLIEDGFATIKERFDLVDRKLTEILESVQKAAAYEAYKSNQDELRLVFMKFQKYLKFPKDKTAVSELRFVCRENDPDAKLLFIFNHVTSSQMFPELLPTMLMDSQYDYKKLLQLSTIVMSDAVKAAFLRQVCLGIAAPNSTELMTDNANTAQVQILSIAKALFALQTELKHTFHEKRLQTDLKDKLKEMQGLNHTQFASKLAAFLRDKYNFVLWSVFAYDDVGTNGSHSLSSNAGPLPHGAMVKMTNGRNLVVTWNNFVGVPWLNSLKTQAKELIATKGCTKGDAAVIAKLLTDTVPMASNAFVVSKTVKIGCDAGEHSLNQITCGFYTSVAF